MFTCRYLNNIPVKPMNLNPVSFGSCFSFVQREGRRSPSGGGTSDTHLPSF